MFDSILQKPELSDPRDPLAKYWTDHFGTVVKTKSGSGIDASEGPWETEFSYQDAVDHVQLGRNTAKVADELPYLRVLLERLIGIFLAASNASTQQSVPKSLDPPDPRQWV